MAQCEPLYKASKNSHWAGSGVAKLRLSMKLDAVECTGALQAYHQSSGGHAPLSGCVLRGLCGACERQPRGGPV